MDKNRIKRHGVRGKLASDSKARKESEQLYVNAARVRRKISHLIRGGLKAVTSTGISSGHSSRWSNDHPGRLGKPNYRAKGQTVRESSRRKLDNVKLKSVGKTGWSWRVGGRLRVSG